MKDAFTTAYSELLRHQIELASIIETVVKDGNARGLTAKSEEVREQLTALIANMTEVTNELSKRYAALVLPLMRF
jgi:flagellar biosynthesis/type III secretory pathway protein FliH